MRKTPQFFKRQSVREVVNKTLGNSRFVFRPLSIAVTESANTATTAVNFSFSSDDQGNLTETVEAEGRGFIDGLFNGMYQKYEKQYPSLSRIALTNFAVNPIMSQPRKSLGTDAQASVLFRVEVGNNGPAEFQHQSRSVIHSGFVTTLDAFQFYINAERAFHKVHFALQDAKSRNRGDTVQACIYSLSKLTEVNNYKSRQEN